LTMTYFSVVDGDLLSSSHSSDWGDDDEADADELAALDEGERKDLGGGYDEREGGLGGEGKGGGDGGRDPTEGMIFDS
jgi:hypothetical protein